MNEYILSREVLMENDPWREPSKFVKCPDCQNINAYPETFGHVQRTEPKMCFCCGGNLEDVDVFKTRESEARIEMLFSKHYPVYFNIVKGRGIRSVVEIGVRAGYSLAAMLDANPNLWYQGYDLFPGEFGMACLTNAQKIAGMYPRADVAFYPGDSMSIPGPLEPVDLVHIDGCHFINYVLYDLELAKEASSTIVVDDYKIFSSVKNAVDAFVRREGWNLEVINSPHGHALVTKE